MKYLNALGRRLLEWGKVENVPGKIEKHLTNRELLYEFSRHFEYELKELSVGHRMIYPMSFNVLLHPDDYEILHDSFPFALSEFVGSFYDIMRKYQTLYPIYKPSPAKDWMFQLSACRVKELPEEVMKKRKAQTQGGFVTGMIQRGEVVIISSLARFDFRKMEKGSKENDSDVEKQRLSMSCRNSEVMKALNWEAMENLLVLANGVYSTPFSDKLNLPDDGTLAIIEGNGIRYVMKDSLICVSSQRDGRTDRMILKLDTDKVVDSHLQIEYLREKEKFRIAAYGLATLNGHLMELSKGGDVHWEDLPDGSILQVAGIELKFTKNK